MQRNLPCLRENPRFENVWSRMLPTVTKMLHLEDVTREELGNLIELLDHLRHDERIPLAGERIYCKLYKIIKDHIIQVQQEIFDLQDGALVKAYIAEWSKYAVIFKYVPMPFLIRPDCDELVTFRELMLEMWSQGVLIRIHRRLRKFAMELVNSERNGEIVESQLIIAVAQSYVNVWPYDDDEYEHYRVAFEKVYLDTTRDFYRVKAQDYLAVNGVQKYMEYADQKLKEEDLRAAKYLVSESLGRLSKCCEEVLLITFKPDILAEYKGFLKKNDIEKLQLVFRLMDRVPDGFLEMLDELENHIFKQGSADMLAYAGIVYQNGGKYVEHLLEEYARFSNLISEAFNDDPEFLTRRDKAFERIVKDTSVFRLELTWIRDGRVTQMPPESYFPKLFAVYCDMLLRKTPLSRKLTSDEVEARLKQVLVFLKYVKNKDVFMVYYEAHLRRRLILATSADSETERCMIEWLRDIGMPADFEMKLSRMFRDIKICKDLNEQFKFTHRNDPGLVDAINIKILNAGAWSRDSEYPHVTLPSELTHFIPPVNAFYRQQHNGRRLQWYHHMSNGVITFTNEAGEYDLEVTTFQMAVLFAWNERKLDAISFEDLMLATHLPETEFRRTLWSLVACPKLKIQVLLYSPVVRSPEDFNYRTVFWINQEFSLIKNGEFHTRGKVNLIGKLQLPKEQRNLEDNETILQLRSHRIQESILKIMKVRRKDTPKGQLRAQLVEILENQFLPPPVLITEQAEWLVEHGFMRTAEDNINVYIYVA